VYVLGGADFIVGPQAPAAQRNIVGVIGKVGVEVGKRVISMRRKLREVIAYFGGKVVHPVLGLPGHMPLVANIYGPERQLVKQLVQG